MSSLFAQYEEASNRYNMPSTTLRPELSTTGFIHMKLEEEPPMFSKLKINIPLKTSVTKLIANNDVMLVALANNSVLRVDMRQPDKIEELELGKPIASPLRVIGLFLDPHGYHALISIASLHGDTQPELLYLSCRSTKWKSSSRARGHEITAVGWNHLNDSDATTGSILLGTSKGLLFESEFLADTDRIFQSSWEKCWRDVFDIGKAAHMPIQGIEFHRSSARSERYFVLVTTQHRLYQFVGNVSGADDRPMLQHIFNSYLNSSIPEGFLEIPSNLKYSRLQFYYKTPREPPKTFGWLTAAGIYHGNVDTTSPPGQDSVVAQSRMLKYPPQDEEITVPVSFVLTQHHALLLYSNRLVAMCLLNEETVFQDNFSAERTGKLIGISKDLVRNTIWVYSERSIFKYKVTQEDRNMWRVYMEKEEFEKAREHCKDNLAHMDQVLIRKAEMLFQKEKYQESAETYADTQSSFEEVALKFLQLWQIEALKTFLCKKLEKLKPQDKTQITMIVVWVIELFLNQLGQLRDSGKGKTTEYGILQRQFDEFMLQKAVQECVRNNCGTIYNLMASHGDKDNLNSFTLLNKDYERVIAHHIQKNNQLEALDILKKQGRKELFYQFAPALMQSVPKQTVQALIEQGRLLAPSRLIPALVMCDQGEGDAQAAEAVRYLEFCVHKLGCQDQAIHNYLLALYARLNPHKLMQYLASQGQDISMVNYDVHYALRLCRERGVAEACVQLSALLGLWEAAVDLALLVSVDLAKQTAAMPHNDPELRKKLWLKIAQHVVEEKDDIQQAMEFLQQCDLIKIEDILPFFSDFVTIDHFKDAICNSLQEYNQHIQDLKEEMEEATKSAEVIREEIQSFRNRYAFVSSKDKCNLCTQQLLAKAFFLFPCSHHFHMDCLQAQVMPLLSSEQRTRLRDLQRQLASMTVKEDTASLGSSAITAREQVRSELDGVVAGECLYCGDNMIRSIDKPFIEEEDFDRITKEWE